MVVDDVNGYLVEIEDSVGLADRVLEVLNLSEADWLLMSDAALSTATKYSWDDATDQLERTFQDLTKQDTKRVGG